MPITRAGGTKGSFYADASYRTAMLRKQAILRGQYQKGASCADSLSAENQRKKPLIGEYHLTQGFKNGVAEVILQKHPNGFI
jgi:hypothetical protein